MQITVTDMFDGVTPETSPITIAVVEGTAGPGGGAVASVNGHVGVVVLGAADVGADASGAAATAQAAAIATASADATTKANAAQAASQPLDSDLTAIAALTTTSYGRALLALADAAAGRTALGLGTAATQASTAFDAAGAAAAAQAASQPLDSDLTAIAALTTTAYGRSLLAAADAAALRTLAGVDASGTAVLKTLYDANTILAATTDDTPAALTVAASRFVGRKATGNITAMTPAEAAAELGSGTRDATTFLRGDNTWAVPSGGGGSSIVTIDTPPASPNAYDYEFDAAATTTLPSGFSWTNQSTSTYNEQNGGGALWVPAGGSPSLHIIEKAIPTGTSWTVIGKFSFNSFAGGAGVVNAGMCVRNSSNGKIATLGWRQFGAMRALHWTNTTTFNANITGDIGWGNYGQVFYCQLKKNSATSYDLLISNEGVYWYTMAAAVDIEATSGTLDKLGWYASPETSAAAVMTCHWLRKTA